MARTLPFLSKPTPAKASLAVQHRALRLANHLQVLSLLDPAAVEYLEHLAADLRVRAELAVQARERRSVQWL